MGFIPTLPFQLGGIVIAILLPIVFWDAMGLFKNASYGVGWIYAMGTGMLMCIFGILYSKGGFWGGAIVFAGMLLAFFTKAYLSTDIIIGISTGTGIISMVLVADRNYRKWEKENEQA